MEKPPITLIGPDRLPQGPFTWEEVRTKIESGEIRPDTLAHTPGLSQWTPVSQVMGHLSRQPLPPPPASGVARPEAYAVTMAPPSHLRFASFTNRMLAYFVDRLLLGLLAVVVVPICAIPAIFLLVFNDSGSDEMKELAVGAFWIGFIIALLILSMLDWFYHAVMESYQGGTIGKKIFGLHVTDMEGKPISFAQACGRHFSRIFVTNPSFLVGYLLALFTERKQALHDLIASTLVVER